jgi:hypothetical protein
LGAFLAAALAIVGPAASAAPVLFVCDDEYFIVLVVDPDTGETHRGFSLPAAAMGNLLPRGRSGLAFDGEQLYYTRSSLKDVCVLDPRSGELRRVVAKPHLDLAGLAVRGESIYAVPASNASGREGSIVRFDRGSGEPLGETALPGAELALAPAAGAGALLVRVGALELRRIDAASGAAERSWFLPVEVAGAAADSRDGTLYVLERSGRISALGPEGDRVQRSFEVFDPSGNAVGSAGGLAFGDLELTDPPQPPEPEAPPEAPPPNGAADGGAGVAIPPLVFDVQDAQILAGFSADVPVLCSNDVPVQGFVIAAIHDPGVLALEAIGIEGTATEAFRADFALEEIFPNGGTLAVVFDLSPPFENNELPPGDDQRIAIYRYRCIQRDLAQPRVTEVRLVDNVLGTPLRENIAVHLGRSLSPVLIPGRITCFPRAPVPDGPAFFCGGPPGPDLRPMTIEVASGDRAGVCFYYTFPDPQGDLIQGLSMGLVHDCRMGCIEESFTIPPESILAAIEADFVSFHCESDPGDGDGCELVLGVLADSVPPFGGQSLPAAEVPQLLACVDLEVGGGVAIGECLEVQFRDGVNGRFILPVKNQVTLESQTVPSITFPCQVCINEVGPGLFCGGGELDERNRPAIPVASAGEEVEVCFWYRSPGEDVYALTQAIRYDCRLECLPETFRVLDPELAGATVTFHCDNSSADGDGCELVLAIEDRPGQPVLSAANAPRKLACVTFRVAAEAPDGLCLALEHRDGLNGSGSAAVDNGIAWSSGPAEIRTFDCQVCLRLEDRPKFYCGGRRLGADRLPEPIAGVERGERTQLCFYYASPVDQLTDRDEIQGLSMAISFDCNLHCFEDSFVTPPDSITAIRQAEFVEFHCDNDPLDGDGCEMVMGIVVDLFPPFDGRTLPPTELPLKVGCVDVGVGPLAKLGFCLDVRFQDGVNGSEIVPVKNLAAIQSQSVSPETFDCSVCVAPLGPDFLCGAGELGRDGLPATPGGVRGEPSELCFWYRSPGFELQGLVMALTHDCRLVCIEDSFHIPDDTVVFNIAPEFIEFRCDGDPDDGDGCEIVLGILVDAAPPFDGRTLPPTDVPIKVGCVQMERPDESECGDCFPVRFTNDINGADRKVRVFNLISIDNMSFLAATIDCEVCTTQTLIPEFVRGDCNFDTRIDISDPAEIISALFGVGTWKTFPVCLDACDANDDGRIDLGDAIYVLLYLFRHGEEPPPPGPLAPGGPDPTEDKIDCDLGPCP